MSIESSTVHLNNVDIIQNTALDDGGGIFLYDWDPNYPLSSTFTHVTISGNTANDGGGMFLNSSNSTFTNSIIWNNSPESIDIDAYYGNLPSTLTIIYSDIEGGWEGEGNIDADPLFTDPENTDYTLMGSSPCIDMGTVLEDMEYCGSAPDMGAYEYITEDCAECGAALGDVNGDSEINILDLVQISYYILELSTPTYECAADYNGDSEVNILDLVQIVTYILEN